MGASGDAAANDESLKLALAVSLLRSKFMKNTKDSNALSPSQSDALLRWKRKAKERKQEILRLREDLKEAQDVSHCDLFPESASCNCYFFNNLGELSPKNHGNDSQSRFNDVLRRRFLRQVRFKERKRRVGSSSSSSQHRLYLGLTEEDETEQLKASVDFLVEMCETVSPVDDSKFASLAHQAVDFILGSELLELLTRTATGDFIDLLKKFPIVSLKNLLSMGRNLELVEGIINSLVTRLIRKMCSSENGSQHTCTNAKFRIQHLVRRLGNESYIGQRAMLSVCQRISVLAERLLVTDPFDDTFPEMHESMFIKIQLIELLVADNLLEWSKAKDFDSMLFEDWVTSIIQARKALELLESRNGLYALYMDRVAGELAKHVGGVSLLLQLKPDIFKRLFNPE